MDEIKKVLHKIVVKADESTPGVIRFRLSTSDTDRDSEVLLPKGMVLKEFKRNPVVLWNHDAWQRPAIGKVLVDTFEITEKYVDADIQFDLEDPFARLIYNKYKGGFLNSGSVRFRPVKIGEAVNDDQQGVTYVKWELLEFSPVNIPANPNAEAVSRELEAEEMFVKSIKTALHNTEIEQDDNKEDASEEAYTESIHIEGKNYPAAPEVAEYVKGLKAGRVLSAKNEKKLKDAYNILGSVLQAVAEEEEPKRYIGEHHEKDGAVIFEKVADEMIALLESDEIDENIYNHLADHYKELGKEPPELHQKQVPSEDNDSLSDMLNAIIVGFKDIKNTIGENNAG